MKTLDAQWLSAKHEYDRSVVLHGPNAIKSKRLWAQLMDLTTRILRRDARKRAA